MVSITQSLEEVGQSRGTIGTSVVKFSGDATAVRGLSMDVDDTLAVLEGFVYTGEWIDHAGAITACQGTFLTSSERSTTPNNVGYGRSANDAK